MEGLCFHSSEKSSKINKYLALEKFIKLKSSFNIISALIIARNKQTQLRIRYHILFKRAQIKKKPSKLRILTFLIVEKIS